jgi:hypothetical protein
VCGVNIKEKAPLFVVCGGGGGYAVRRHRDT